MILKNCHLLFLFVVMLLSHCYGFSAESDSAIPLYFWRSQRFDFINFGDYLSLKLLEKITDGNVLLAKKDPFANERKLLAIGSIIHFASGNDVIWGSGVNGKHLYKNDYRFTFLDARAVRGPLTKQFLAENFNIDCPEVYGDPALLLPYFFPEFHKSETPFYEYIIIPHYSEEFLFPKTVFKNVVYPTDPWEEVLSKILDAKLVISSSLHGIVVAEAFNVPARMLKITENEPLFKFKDYYLGTGRPHFCYAKSVEEALQLGGERPFACDLKKLYEAFPFDCFPKTQFKRPNFSD